MSATLRPHQRDVLLAIFDGLTDASLTLTTRAVIASHAVTVSDALFDAVHSTDRLPALAGEQLMRLLALVDAPKTYGEAVRALLLGFPAVAQRRAEQAEEARWAAMEVQAEKNAEKARQKAAKAAELEAKEKARRKAEEIELAHRAKLEPAKPSGWRALYQKRKAA